MSKVFLKQEIKSRATLVMMAGLALESIYSQPKRPETRSGV